MTETGNAVEVDNSCHTCIIHENQSFPNLKNMKKTKEQAFGNGLLKFIALSVFLFCVSFAYAQNRIVGKVADSSGEPVIGASVAIQGTANGSVTDLDGIFSISNAPKEGTLVVSYIGFATQKIAINGHTRFDIVLQEDHQTLNEVVVVGYGVQRKSDVTGALAHIGSEQLTAMPVKNVLEGMQGKTAGVDITNSQRPGTVGSIIIRGERSIAASNSPLYVVDGMIIQNGSIDNLNPQDIESIEVLKDASATAIYGSRGANGVVLVTTKKGKEGRVTLNYAGTVTLSNIHEVTKMMSASQWIDYARLALYNQGSYGKKQAAFSPDYASDKELFGGTAGWSNIERAWVDGVYHPELVGSYDWTSAGKQTGVTSEHTISASGGTDKFKGYGSFGYLNQKGTQPRQSYSRFTLNTSFEAKPVDYFTLGMTMNASYGSQNYGYSFTKSVTGSGDYYSALQSMLPWTVPYDENGNYIRNPWSYNVNIINPINELRYNTNKRRNFRINGSVYGQLDFGKIWEPLAGLSYRIQFGPELQYYRLGVANAADGINGDGNNVAQYNPYQRVAWTLDNLIYYNKTIAKEHSIGITLLQSASKYHYETGNIKANVASAEELWYNIGSLGDPLAYTTGLTETQMASYMIRGNYSFKDRYLLTASMRWDGASQLSKGHKWSSFPSVALGWRVDQEDFMKSLAWISQLKLRLGYGVSGNAAINAYATKGAVQSLYYNWGTNPSALGYVPSDPSSKSPAMMANQGLGWERTTQYNLGLDFGFLNGRIGGSFDIYKTKTKDLLLAMTIPSLTGYTSTYANVGRTSGWGIDLQLNAIPVKQRDLEWNTAFTWSMDRNRIEELANGKTEDVNNRLFVGEEIGVYYDYVYDGIWKTSEAETAAKYGAKPGQIRVKDCKEDGKIDANDRRIVGRRRPRWSAGWHNTLSYKDFELSFFIYSRWKFMVPRGTETLGGMYMMRDLDYWVAGTNEDAEYYSPGSNGSAADPYASSMGYQDGSYIKMRNISLGYNVGKKVLKHLGLSSAKVYVQAMNPFSIYKKCKWLDTDLLSYDNNTTSYGSAVTIKSWVFGLNIGF